MEVALASVSLVSGEESTTRHRPGSPLATRMPAVPWRRWGSRMNPTHAAAQLLSEKNTQPSKAAGAAAMPSWFCSLMLLISAAISTSNKYRVHACKVALSDPMDCRPLGLLCPWGFSRQEYWSGLPFPSPGESSRLRDWTHVSYVSCIGKQVLYHYRNLGSPK